MCSHPSFSMTRSSTLLSVITFFHFITSLLFTLVSCSYSHHPSLTPLDQLFEMDSKEYSFKGCSKRPRSTNDNISIEDAFEMLDAGFFTKEKMMDVVKEASEFNLPTIRANRKLIASSNGGLNYPSALSFHSDWGEKHAEIVARTFAYPSCPDIQRPDSEEDIALMSVLELGQLIKTKKISSVELTEIFMRRLKRYNHVLQAVVSVTEELAYKQAKEADQLLSQGVYLGPLHGIPYGLKFERYNCRGPLQDDLGL